MPLDVRAQVFAPDSTMSGFLDLRTTLRRHAPAAPAAYGLDREPEGSRQLCGTPADLEGFVDGVLHAEIVRVERTAVNGTQIEDARQFGVDLLPRIKSRVATLPNGANRELAWLAEQLRIPVQTVSSWTTRGVPAARYQAIATAVGWSVDELLGKPAPPPAWPFEAVSYDRWQRLTERQKGRIEAAILHELEAIEAEQIGKRTA